MTDTLSYIKPLSGKSAIPELLNSPFSSSVPMVVEEASEALSAEIEGMQSDAEELARGKMFGVLVVELEGGELGYLSAFSGTLGGELVREGFVPPIFDYTDPKGYYMSHEDSISQINEKIKSIECSSDYTRLLEELNEIEAQAQSEIEAKRTEYQEAKALRAQERDSAEFSMERMGELSRQSQQQKGDLKRLLKYWQERVDMVRVKLSEHSNEIQALKAERKVRSAILHRWLFDNFLVLNGMGQRRSLTDIFSPTPLKTPPSGAGECAAPKLLHFALERGLRPVAIGEFWWGASPKGVVRHSGHFYEACRGKCGPILGYMLEGIEVQGATSIELSERVEVPVIYEDSELMVVDKPSGLLTVPGRGSSPSLLSILSEGREELMVVHRLDMDTSGLVVLAKNLDSYRHLQREFMSREVSKLYTAILDGKIEEKQGTISLPLIADILDRPRQMVDYHRGKPSTTHYRVVEEFEMEGRVVSRLLFTPVTGRTHQLRVHSAHCEGLSTPIVGDRLYGTISSRLFLHATELKFTHPLSGKRLEFISPAPF